LKVTPTSIPEVRIIEPRVFGDARGFFLYKTTDYYAPDYERRMAWNDPDLAIAWPSNRLPQFFAKDSKAPSLHFCELPPH